MFSLGVNVDQLFFIGAQLVALSPTGRIGVWNSLANHWQVQELAPITAHDKAGKKTFRYKLKIYNLHNIELFSSNH